MQQDIESLIHRIVSGSYKLYINSNIYIIKSPNLEIRSRAHFIYKTIIEENKFDTDSWVSDSQIQTLLAFNNIWNKNKQQELDNQIKLLDANKIELFLNYSNDKQRKKLKETINSIKLYINQLYDQKNSFNFLSLESYAKTIQNQFLILNMVYKDNALLFDSDINNIDTSLMSDIIQELQDNQIDMDMMKNIVKSEIWRNYWNATKEKVIDKPSSELTEEQLTILNLSKTYDSIREHPEAPTEEIIQDNDALDGWMIHQNKKMEQEKKKKHIEDKFGLKDKNGQEVFILTDSVEETKEIFDLNNPEAKHKIKQIKQISKDNKETKWADVPFVKQELQQQQRAAINQKG